MVKKQKGRFVQFFSLSRHKKRLGGQRASELLDTDFAAQKEVILEGETPTYTYGANKELLQHLEDLKQELAWAEHPDNPKFDMEDKNES